MALSVEMVTKEALSLLASGRVSVVESLLVSLAAEISPSVERADLNEIQARRASVQLGKARLVDGPEGMQKARAALRK